jgi:hypothetical protein
MHAYASPQRGKQPKPKRADIPVKLAKRWVREISPTVQSFGERKATAADSVQVPISMLVDLDEIMVMANNVSSLLLERMMEQLKHLRQFIPLDTFASAVEGLKEIRADQYAHARDPNQEFSDSEVLALWDQLERILFELVGSPSWAYESVDKTIEELERL